MAYEMKIFATSDEEAEWHQLPSGTQYREYEIENYASDLPFRVMEFRESDKAGHPVQRALMSFRFTLDRECRNVIPIRAGDNGQQMLAPEGPIKLEGLKWAR